MNTGGAVTSQLAKRGSVCLKVPGCYGVSVLPRTVCSHGSLDVTDVARPAVSAYGQHCRPERSEQARMLGFASLGYVTRWRQSPPHEMGMGGVFDLGPASSALPGPQGSNILELISLGHRANKKF